MEELHRYQLQVLRPLTARPLQPADPGPIAVVVPAGIGGPGGSVTGKRAQLHPIGVIHSTIKKRSEAPRQPSEGAPDAWLVVNRPVAPGLEGIHAGSDIIVITWLHRARRQTLKVHPRSDPRRRLLGVFATRSPDRPNPLGLHRVTVRRVAGSRLRIGPIEVIDGTPVLDIKPVLSGFPDF